MWQWAVGILGLGAAGWWYNREERKPRIGDTVTVDIKDLRVSNIAVNGLPSPGGLPFGLTGVVQLYVSRIVDGVCESSLTLPGGNPVSVNFFLASVKTVTRNGRTWPYTP